MESAAKIIVIDDDAIASFIIKKNLMDKGYVNLLFAEHSSQAIQIFKTEQPEIAIVDLNIGNESGISLAQELLKMNTALKIIFLSSSIDPAQIQEAKKIKEAKYVDRFASFDDITNHIEHI